MSNLIKVPAGITVTPNSITLPEDTTKQTWADVGKKLVYAGNSCKWLMGDWAAFGAEHFPESVKGFCDIHGLDYGTIRNLAHVSRQFKAERRRQKLAFDYFREVSQLQLFEQNQMLDKAEVDKLSVGELRHMVRKAQGSDDSSVSDGKSIRTASKACDELVAFLESRPADFFDDDARRTVWKSRIKPIAELYSKL